VQDAEHLGATLDLAQRLRRAEPDVEVLLTTPLPVPPDLPAWIRVAPLPGERVAEVRDFLASWAPDAALWIGGPLRPALMLGAQQAGVPMALINADPTLVQAAGGPLRRRLARQAMQGVGHVLASNDDSAEALARLGIAAPRIEAPGPLCEAPLPLPVDPEALDHLAAQVAGRPLWLAANVAEDEVDLLLSAHRTLRRINRRLLLVLEPCDKGAAEVLGLRLTGDGWRLVRRTDGDVLTEGTQILLADSEDELGLWYRLSPISFMGGTLGKAGQGQSPFHPANLGSAVLHGPRRKPYVGLYEGLARMAPPAARMVRSEADLVRAINELLSPDLAAAMAHAGWDWVSRGAATSDRVIALVSEALDMVGVGDA
jgi:3-deoxy-D-manno-octulosonic-acid transferase